MGAAYPRAAQIRISRDAEGAVSSLAAVHRNGSDGGTRTICRDSPNAAGGRAGHPIARTLHCRRRRRAKHRARSAGSGRRDGLRPISPSSDFARKGAATGRRLERTPDRESRSMGLPLRVRRLSISPDLDGSDRRRPSRLGPGVVAGSFQRHRRPTFAADHATFIARSEEHTSELQSRPHLVCRLLLEKKKKQPINHPLSKKKKKKKKKKK